MLPSNTSYEKMLREFQIKFGHFMSNVATTSIPNAVKNLRLKLIEEEYMELRNGLMTDNLSEIADGAADLIYVIIGCCTAYGIPIDRVFREVHRSNMTKTAAKVEPGQKYGTKTPKGPNYVPPAIDQILQHPEQYTLLEKRSI